MAYQTKVVNYSSEKEMQRGIRVMQRRGWEVVTTSTTDEGYGCFKTATLGCLFLPLALLGKKPKKYTVQYRRPKA